MIYGYANVINEFLAQFTIRIKRKQIYMELLALIAMFNTFSGKQKCSVLLSIITI